MSAVASVFKDVLRSECTEFKAVETIAFGENPGCEVTANGCVAGRLAMAGASAVRASEDD